MSSIYVSYRSSERAFVEEVVRHLEPEHDIVVDYKLPVGAAWRRDLEDGLRRAQVFLIFVSAGTPASEYQNAEVGAALFSSAFVDNKLVIPVLIDRMAPPRTLAELDYLDASDRDPRHVADEIRDAMARRLSSRIQLFISHAHRDVALASRLVDVLEQNLAIPPGELRCTSVPGYQIDLGAMAPDVLRRELGSSAAVIALITPNSVGADWVLFELGAAWANAKLTLPLLAGDLQEKDIPGPMRGAAGGHLREHSTLDRLLDQLVRQLKWRTRTTPQSQQKKYDLAEFARQQTFASDSIVEELNASFVKKRAVIGSAQGRLLDYLTSQAGRPYVSHDELKKKFADVTTTVYYRLEQLRLLGFLDREQLGEHDGQPIYGWKLSRSYRKELGLG